MSYMYAYVHVCVCVCMYVRNCVQILSSIHGGLLRRAERYVCGVAWAARVPELIMMRPARALAAAAAASVRRYCHLVLFDVRSICRHKGRRANHFGI